MRNDPTITAVRAFVEIWTWPTEDERVLFQPFHSKRHFRGLRCDHFTTSADLLALIVSEKMQFP